MRRRGNTLPTPPDAVVRHVARAAVVVRAPVPFEDDDLGARVRAAERDLGPCSTRGWAGCGDLGRRRVWGVETFDDDEAAPPAAIPEPPSAGGTLDSDAAYFELLVKTYLGEPALSRYLSGTYVNDPVDAKDPSNRPYTSVFAPSMMSSPQNLVLVACGALFTNMAANSNLPRGTRLCARRLGKLTYLFPSTWYGFGKRFKGDLGVEARVQRLLEDDAWMARALGTLSAGWGQTDPRQQVVLADLKLRRSGLSPVMGLYPAFDETRSPPVLRGRSNFGGVSYHQSMLIGLSVGPANSRTATKTPQMERDTLVHEYAHKFAAAVPGGAEHNAIFFITFADVLMRLGNAGVITPSVDKQVFELVNFDKDRDAAKLAMTYGKWRPSSKEELEAVLQAVNLTQQLSAKDGTLPSGQTIGKIRYNAFLRNGRGNWLAMFPDQDRLFDSTWNFAASGYVEETADEAGVLERTRPTPYLGFKAGYVHNGTRYIPTRRGIADLGPQLGYGPWDAKAGYVPLADPMDDPAYAAWASEKAQAGPFSGERVGMRWTPSRTRYEPWADDPKLRSSLVALKPLDLSTLKPDSDPAWARAVL